MDFKEFSYDLINKLEKIDVDITSIESEKFYTYMKLLIEENKKINLTAITDEKDIILKHFVDCITINKYLKESNRILDIGTGAGFPGIPLKIINENKNFTLVDSLNKRIEFLKNICLKLNLSQIECIHSRAEELAKIKEHRESYDIVLSRAVAKLNVLVEYMMPFTKVGGKCICMKGSNIKEELDEAEKVIKILGGKIEKIDKIILPESDIQRNIIIIKKISNTPNEYPRKPGVASKKPIV